MEHRSFRRCLAIVAAMAFGSTALAQEGGASAQGQSPGPAVGGGPPVWQLFVRGGGVYQFSADLDGGGDFEVGRFFIQPGVTWTPDPERLSISFAAAYGRDNYSFSGDQGLAGLRPWDDVENVRLGASIRWKLDDQWTIFTIPTVRWTAETGGDLGDGFTGGALAGASYKFSDKLSIGPGIGVLSEIEDDVSVFPILLIDWKITDTLSIQTGQGLGATQGPGLSLVWDFADDWSLAVGARYERIRFRLDDDGVGPGGVGEERSIPFFVGVTWTINDNAEVAAVGGVNFDGELRLEDDNGRSIIREDYDPAGFLGLTFRVRF